LPEAFAGRLVEAIELFQIRNQFGVQTLRAAVAALAGADGRTLLFVAAARVTAAARDACRGVNVLSFQLSDELLDRPAGRCLNDDEVDHHDGEQGWHNQQQATNDISRHRPVLRRCSPRLAANRFMG
jgi:hypothetical protein